MAEEFVGRKEFESLKNNVEKIQNDMIQNAKTLASIDGKIDIIKERLTSADEISDLKMKPLNERVSNLEDNQKWLWRTTTGAIITLILGIVVAVIKILK